MEFKITTLGYENYMEIKISGCMYVEDILVFKEKIFDIIKQGHKEIFIDMSALEYLDVACLGSLVLIHKYAIKNSARIILRGVSGLAKELLEITRLTKVLFIENEFQILFDRR